MSKIIVQIIDFVKRKMILFLLEVKIFQKNKELQYLVLVPSGCLTGYGFYSQADKLQQGVTGCFDSLRFIYASLFDRE